VVAACLTVAHGGFLAADAGALVSALEHLAAPLIAWEAITRVCPWHLASASMLAGPVALFDTRIACLLVRPRAARVAHRSYRTVGLVLYLQQLSRQMYLALTVALIARCARVTRCPAVVLASIPRTTARLPAALMLHHAVSACSTLPAGSRQVRPRDRTCVHGVGHLNTVAAMSAP